MARALAVARGVLVLEGLGESVALPVAQALPVPVGNRDAVAEGARDLEAAPELLAEALWQAVPVTDSELPAEALWQAVPVTDSERLCTWVGLEDAEALGQGAKEGLPALLSEAVDCSVADE